MLPGGMLQAVDGELCSCCEGDFCFRDKNIILRYTIVVARNINVIWLTITKVNGFCIKGSSDTY